MIVRSLFIIFLFNSQLLLAQSVNLGTPVIKNFPKEIYNAGPQNWDIQQDDRGVLYFANNGGLLQFDGSEWKVYGTPKRTIIRSVLIANSGEIYIGGQNELGYFFPNEQGVLTFHSLMGKMPEEHQKFDDVWDIVSFPLKNPTLDNSIFFKTSNKVFFLKDNKITLLEHAEALHFFGKTGGELFLHAEYEGLKKFNGKVFELVEDGARLKGMKVTGVLKIEEVGMLISTAKNGLFLKKNNVIRPLDSSLQNFFKEKITTCALHLSDGKIAIGTLLGGVVVLDQKNRPIWHLNIKNGLQNNNIIALTEDAAGSLWVAEENGIDFVQTDSPINVIKPDQELEGTAYTAAIHDDKIFFGTSTGLYCKEWKNYYDPFQSVDFQLVENTRGQVWGLDKIGDDLFLGHNDGAFQVEKNRARPLGGNIGAWKFLPIDSENYNKTLAGTYTGIELLEKKIGSWKFSQKMQGLEESSRILAKDTEGNFWMAHPYRGIFKIELNSSQNDIKQVSFYGKNKGLPSDLLNHVFLVFDQILVTAERGVFIYNKNKDLFEPFQTFNDIFGAHTFVKRLIEDEAGNVWFVAENDVGCLRIVDQGLEKKVEKILLPELRGKLVGGFEFIFPYDEKNVFIGMEKGFIHYDPTADVASKKQKPQVLISKIELLPAGSEKGLVKDSLLFDGAYVMDGKRTVAQPENVLLEFPASQNALRFTFSSPEFSNPELIEYQYFMEGGDEVWSAWTTKNEKEYNHLGYGDYVFYVKARKGENEESETVQYTFRIHPPWYASSVAIGIYVFSMLAFLMGIILVPRRKYQKETEQLKSEHQMVVEESEREISTLKNEKLEAEIEHQNQALATTTMHLVQKTEMLNRMKEELKKISKNKEFKDRKEIEKIIRMIDQDARLDDDWEQFSLYFDKVHSNFLKKLSNQFPQLTPKDRKLCAYLRMNLTTKEIAPLMNISVRGVEISRYRLRKKLELPGGENLVGYLMNL